MFRSILFAAIITCTLVVTASAQSTPALNAVRDDASNQKKVFVNVAINYSKPLRGKAVGNGWVRRNKFADFSPFSIGLQSEILYMPHPNFGIIPISISYNRLSTDGNYYPSIGNPSAWALSSMVGVMVTSRLSIFRPFGQFGTGLRHLSITSGWDKSSDKSTDMLFSVGGGTYVELNETVAVSLKLLYQTILHDQTAEENVNDKISGYGEFVFNLGCAVFLF